MSLLGRLTDTDELLTCMRPDVTKRVKYQPGRSRLQDKIYSYASSTFLKYGMESSVKEENQVRHLQVAELTGVFFHVTCIICCFFLIHVP